MSLDDVATEVRRLGIPLGAEQFRGDAPVASQELLDLFEERFGFSIPDDYRWFLQHGSHQTLEAIEVRVPRRSGGDGRLVAGRLEPLLDFTSLKKHVASDGWVNVGVATDMLYEIDEEADRRFYEYLLPISSGQHSYLYALDFRFDPVAPPVVLVQADSGNPGARFDPTIAADVTDFYRYVAPSFTQMLRQVVRSDETDPMSAGRAALDETPYPWADQVLAWEAFTDAYLAEHTGPIAPRKW